jgi:PAS domain S-box-containing protein
MALLRQVRGYNQFLVDNLEWRGKKQAAIAANESLKKTLQALTSDILELNHATKPVGLLANIYWENRFNQMSPGFILSILPIIIGSLAIIGWEWDIGALKWGIASSVSMNPATAVGFILLGLETLRLNSRNNAALLSRVGQLAVSVVIMASAMQLFDCVFGDVFRIDELLFTAKLSGESGHGAVFSKVVEATGHPSRMAPNTALCFFMLGWVMLFMRSVSESAIRIAQTLTAVTSLVALMAIAGYAYGVKSFVGIGAFIPMAINTAVAFLSLCMAALLAHPGKGFMRVFTGGSISGLIASTLLPVVVIIPFLFGWISLAGERAGYYDMSFALALSVILNIAVLFSLTYISVKKLFLSEAHRQSAETELRDSERKYRSLVESAGDAIFLADAVTGNLVDCNRKAEELVGRPKNEIIGMHQSQLHPPDKAEEYRDIFRNHVETGKEIMDDLLVVHKDGRHIPVDIRATMFEIQGKFLVQGIFRDITGRKRVEEALMESEALFRGVFDYSKVGVNVLGPDYKYTKVNRAFCDMVGYSEKELLSHDFKGITHPDDIGPNLNLSNKLRAGEIDFFHLEKRYIHKNGGVVWGDLTVSSVRKEDGSVQYVVALVQDITERKLAENELRIAKEQAESATKLKDQFVSLVAHDLRSPFTSMMGLLRYFAGRKSFLANEEDRKAFDTVFQSGDRMLAMIEDLLKTSRLQTGQVMPNPRFFKANTAVAVTIGSISHTAAQKGIEIINEVPEAMRLYADQSLFDEVLLNLLSNAIKFCSSGDRVTFFAPPESQSAIAIRDAGKGINEAAIPNLFKHEVKTSTPGTAGEMGTGLGLPYSHDIMKAHGGDITVESAPGKGCVFTVILPYVPPVALVVDDEPSALLIAKTHLEGIGIEVILASDGGQALTALKDKRPHIIITDINMPGMDGFALLDRLKKESATRDIPVIVMTSMESETRENAFSHGADDFVSKPIMVEDFIPRVRRFVG